MAEAKGTEKAPPAGGNSGQEQFLDKLRNALSQDGDFPTSAKIVGELKLLTSDPNTTANQIAEVILREPSLGVRVLHVVNSSFYRRAKQIMTISQAVIQIGMKPLAELCAGLVLLQKFGSISRRGHAFTQCLSRTVMSSLLTGSLAQKVDSGNAKDEYGYLAGSVAEMGSLLLAYYFPEVYENAVKRAEAKKQSVDQAIGEIVGLTPLQLSLEVVSALKLPDFYKALLKAAHGGPGAAPTLILPSQQALIPKASKVIVVATSVSDTIVSGRGKEALDQVLAKAKEDLGLEVATLTQVIGDLSKTFQDHCGAVDINLPPLPEYISTYTLESSTTGTPTATSGTAAKPKEQDPFIQFVEEIRQMVDNREPSASVITTVMETLAWGLKFDRVLLMIVGPSKKSLLGRMALGTVGDLDPRKFERPLGSNAGPYAPDSVAFSQSHPVFTGDPIFENGWPFAAIPIGAGNRAIGVVYADRTRDDAEELTGQEQAAIGMLTELLDRALTVNA